jgi:autonomous glycyl radical cofactor GrcA
MSCDCNTLVVGEAGAQGPQGLAGINGTNGTNGLNAFTTTSASFVQPALNVSVTFSVVENRWIAVGQTIYISNAGFYRVTSVGGSPYSSVTAVLVKTDGVVNPSTVSSGLKVSPSSSALYTAPLSSLQVIGNSDLNGAVTINDSKAAVDFVVRGDTADNLLIADASSDRVGVNIAVPTATLDVAGTLKVSSTAQFLTGATVNFSQADSDFSVRTQVFSNTLYVDANTDRVGIATSSPLKLLDVAGDAQINTLLVNPTGVADNIKPVFQVLGTSNSIYPITVKATSGPTVNRVGIFNASPSVELDVTGETKISGNLSVDTNVLKVDAAANFVGINKTSPTVALDVTGELAVSGVSTLNSLTVTGAANVGTTLGVTGASTLASLSVTGAASVGGNFSVETSTFKVDTSSNRVGVNTSSPTVELDVVGETKISGNLSVDTSVLKVDSAGNLVGINKTTPEVALDVVGETKISGNLSVDTNVLKVDTTDNRVGINKTTPTVPLDVTGAVQATSYQIEASAGKITKFYKSSVPLESTTDLTSLTGAGTFQTYIHSVPGVLAGDFAQVTYSSSDNNFEDEVMISAYCTSDNVHIVFFNMGATDFGVTTTAEITINIFITRAAAS